MIHCEAEGLDRLELAAVWLQEVLSEQHHSGRCVHHHAAPDLPWGSAGGRDASVGPPRDDRRALRHLNANNDVLQLIAQFVRSVESSEGCRAVRYVCQTPAPIGYYYEPGQSGW